MNLDSPKENALMEVINTLLEARVFAYDLLRQTYLAEPLEGFYSTLKEEDFLHAFPFANESDLIQEGVQLATGYLEAHDANQEEALDRLRGEYTRLFIGPAELPAPPWESVYLSRDRLLFQKQTMEVRRVYRKFGYVPTNYPHEADDHLGLELDFMFRLASRTKEETSQNYLDSAFDLLQEQASFLEDHLLEWVPELCEDILQAAETSFYQGMAKILHGYLQHDREVIDELSEVLREKGIVR
jgi:TorA maturation chaperone TorD